MQISKQLLNPIQSYLKILLHSHSTVLFGYFFPESYYQTFLITLDGNHTMEYFTKKLSSQRLVDFGDILVFLFCYWIWLVWSSA